MTQTLTLKQKIAMPPLKNGTSVFLLYSDLPIISEALNTYVEKLGEEDRQLRKQLPEKELAYLKAKHLKELEALIKKYSVAALLLERFKELADKAEQR